MNNEQNKLSLLEKADRTIIGFMIGLIVPMLMLVFYYQFKYSTFSWNEYISGVKQVSTLPSFIKVCVFGNLPVFFLFNLVQKFNLCKGIFIASMLYIIAMFVVKYAF